MITDVVLCPAPLTALVVDTNKGVRPCCAYTGNYVGNLKEQTISTIINSDEWRKIKQQMYNKEWPDACLPCKEREEITNWSVRKLFTDGNFDVEGWQQEKLTYLEFNGSNICNLSCLHCNAGFSSRWVGDVQKARKVAESYNTAKYNRLKWMDALIVYTDDSNNRSTKMHLPNPEIVLNSLKEIDLTDLRTINFKGGEPLLNSETVTILEYLDQQCILQNVTIAISSNGTYINDKIVELFKKCKSIKFYLSVDGTGELFNYIRYGDAKFSDIEPTLARLNEIDNIEVRCNAAVMNYNIFNLLDIREWTVAMSKKYNKVNAICGFANCVQHPAYLSLRTLSDETRKELIEFYTNNTIHYQEFGEVISTLSSEYSGNEMHNHWIEYTELMQTVRKNNILDIVPRLKEEMVKKWDR